jgi:tetratricopeptide (TPR) repeat protein
LTSNPLSSEEREHLVCKYEVAANGLNASNYVETLLIRDQIQALLTEQTLSSEHIKRIYDADIVLRAKVRSLDRSAILNRNLFQQTILPPVAHWWWQPIEEPLLWNIISVAALAITGALATQFTARILSKNPDAWGVSAVVLQGALTLLAGGTFTTAGRSLFKKIGLGGITTQARACLATILAVIVLALWYFLPSALARRYNRIGLEVCPSNLSCPDLEKAITMFERASSLDPDNAVVHYNFGRVYELAFDYDRAIEQYKEAVNDASDSPAALSNWARLLVIQKKDLNLALTLLDDAVNKADKRSQNGNIYWASPGIFKNRGLANYQAGFYLMAEKDLKRSLELQQKLGREDMASPHCLLAMTNAKLGDSSAEFEEATKCIQVYQKESSQAVGLSPKVDADSIRFAKDLTHTTY